MGPLTARLPPHRDVNRMGLCRRGGPQQRDGVPDEAEQQHAGQPGVHRQAAALAALPAPLRQVQRAAGGVPVRAVLHGGQSAVAAHSGVRQPSVCLPQVKPVSYPLQRAPCDDQLAPFHSRSGVWCCALIKDDPSKPKWNLGLQHALSQCFFSKRSSFGPCAVLRSSARGPVAGTSASLGRFVGGPLLGFARLPETNNPRSLYPRYLHSVPCRPSCVRPWEGHAKQPWRESRCSHPHVPAIEVVSGIQVPLSASVHRGRFCPGLMPVLGLTIPHPGPLGDANSTLPETREWCRCLTSRDLLKHHQKCQHSNCPICTPVKQYVQKQRQEMQTHQQVPPPLLPYIPPCKS